MLSQSLNAFKVMFARIHILFCWPSSKRKIKLVFLALLLNGVMGHTQKDFKIHRLETTIPGHKYQLIPMAQDSLGYMWISSIYGINKYNGDEYVPFTYEEIFHRAINGDEIEQIIVDGQGIIWVKSEFGYVARLNHLDDFSSLSAKGAPLEGNRIERIFAHKNKLWMVTQSGELLRFNPAKDIVEFKRTLPKVSGSNRRVSRMVMTENKRLFLLTSGAELMAYDVPSDSFKLIRIVPPKTPYVNWADMALDKNGRLWIGTTVKDLGIIIYEPESGKFVQDDHLGPDILSSAKATFYAVISDTSGNIWLGTDGKGLLKIDPMRRTIDTLTYDRYDSKSLSSNSVLDLYEDSKGYLWITCNYGRINLFKDTPTLVKTHSGSLDDSPFKVRSTLRSADGSLWIGTEGKGILRVDSLTGEENIYLISEEDDKDFSVLKMIEADANTIWVSTNNNGLWKLDKRTKKATPVPVVNKEGVHMIYFFTLHKDLKNRIWVMTNGGFFVYSAKGDFLAEFSGDYFNIDDATRGRNVVETDDGTLWIGAKSGLFKLEENSADLRKSIFVHHKLLNDDVVSGVAEGIMSMDLDTDGVLWIVSDYKKLYSFHTNTHEFKDYEHIEGINGVNFVSVIAQGKHTIWLGSHNGMWRLNTNTEEFRVFSENEGFLDSWFLEGSYKDKEGHLYFLSVNGINYFNPDKLEKSIPKARLVIENIEILNQPAQSVIPDQLTRGIAQTDRIELTYDQASFSIRFLALEHVLSPKYFYSYRLKGLDDNWVNLGNMRTASYTKVPDGDYVFQVRAGTESGLWDIPIRTVKIHIAPPFYRHPLAYLGYALLVAGLVVALIRWLRLRRRLVIQQLEYERDKELYDMKMDFFAKISHEIQTPLSLILIPIENMLRSETLNKSPTTQRRLNMVRHNVKRLSRIVFELTSVRNKEIGKLKANFVRRDLKTDLTRVMGSFQELAESQNINLTFNADGDEWRVVYDSEKLEHVFYNLLSNAFKFTPKGGSIEIALKRNEKEESALISFTNTGATIPEKDQERIFELFYQGKEEQSLGTGIGLALSKELVDLHQGNITVDSKNGVTCFIVVLPLDLKTSSVGVMPSETMLEPEVDQSDISLPKIDHTPAENELDKTVLIVEDNFELRDYLKELYSPYYKVLLASDGLEGYDLAVGQLPQLIVSDIMMPKKNGIEMATELRDTKTTAHIPIILMTAEDNPRNRVSSLRAGVIEYVAKPFSTNELLLKSHNIVTRSERLVTRIKADLIVSPSKPTVRSKDVVFLENLVGHIDSRMEDAEFRIEELSTLMHMSHSSLYRKCQALTGKTLVEFVRSMRIKKAAMYLNETNYSVADAAYVVGFNDVKYFSKCFRKEFGKSPAKYKKATIEEGL